MLKFGNKEFRNLQEQVYKNMKDISYILQEEGVLNEFGIKVVGQEESVMDMPTVADYKENNPDWSYGDSYAIGEEEPYELYILTRANGTHPDDYWFNIGEFPAPGPQGPQGETGPQGPQGQTGATGADGLDAGFGTVSATATTLDAGEDATVSVSTSGPDTAMNIAFTFGIPKGQDGDVGTVEWGEIGGDITDQEDLVTALQGKQNASNAVTTDGSQTISGNKTFTGSTSFGGGGAISISSSGINVYSPAAIRTYGADVNLSGSLVLGSSKIRTSGSDTYGLAIPSTTSYTADKTIATTDDIINVSGTNDGTNWTSITIGSTTKAIPSGGSGPTPSNMVTTNTDQTITGTKTFESNIKLRNESVKITNYSDKSLLSFGAAGYIKLGSTSAGAGGVGTHNFNELRLDATSVVPDGGSTTTLNSNLGTASKKWNSLYVSQLKDGNAANYATGLQLPDMTNWTASKTIATTDDIPVIPANIVEDVEVNGTSVVTSGVAAVTVPTDTSDLTNTAGFITGIDSSDVITALGYTPGTSNFSGSYTDLTDKPDLSIYAESSDLATVATTGDYDDLLNKPTIPAAQVNSDWDAVSGVSQILNKPSLATVATSGSYNDLSNKPTIPDTTYMVTTNTAQTISGAKTFSSAPLPSGNYQTNLGNSNHHWSNIYATKLTNSGTYGVVVPNSGSWTADKTIATTDQIPSLTGYATESWVTNQGYSTFSGSYNDLTNKPTIPTISGTNDGTNWTSITINSDTYAIPQGGSSGVTDVTLGGTSVVSGGVAVLPAYPSVPVTDVELDNVSIVSSGVAELTSETWTFTLSDGTTITKKILVG